MDSLRTQTALDIQQFVLAFHERNCVDAEEHFLLGESVLEELVDGDQSFVSKNVYL